MRLVIDLSKDGCTSPHLNGQHAGRWCNSELPGVVANVLNRRLNRPVQILFPPKVQSLRRAKYNCSQWLAGWRRSPQNLLHQHHHTISSQNSNLRTRCSTRSRRQSLGQKQWAGWCQWVDLSTQCIAKELHGEVCLFLPSTPEVYLQGVQSALHVLRYIMDLARHKDSEFELSGIVVFLWQVFS